MNYEPLSLQNNRGVQRQPRDPVLTVFVIGMIAFVLGLAVLIAVGVKRSETAYREFLRGCEQDHKHYECVLLWRSTEQKDPLVVPEMIFR